MNRKKKNFVRENGHFNIFTDIRVHLKLGKIALALLLILQVNMIAIDTVEATTIRLQDVPLGSVIYDDTWQIPIYNEGRYGSVTGWETVEWRVVAKDYYDEKSVTLLSNISWGRTQPHSISGCTSDAMYLMGNQKSRFTDDFNNLIKPVTVPYFGIRNSTIPPGGSSTITVNGIYLPSWLEVIDWNVRGHFSAYGQSWWTRTHGSWINGYTRSQIAVYYSGSSIDIDGSSSQFVHHIPAINLDGNTRVELQGGNYKIIYNQTPTTTITSYIENKYFV